MKRINEYTDEELAALTQDQIDFLVDYECAKNGVPLLPLAPPPEPSKPDTPTVYAYECAGIHFTKKADAQKILDVLDTCEIYNTDGWGDNERLVKLNPQDWNYPKLTKKDIMSKETYEKHKSNISVYTAEIEEWKKIKKCYEEAVTSRNTVVIEVNSTVSAAIRRLDLIEDLKRQFARYVELAGGDYRTAMSFLDDAKALTSEQMTAVWPDWDSPVDAPSEED